jgi:GNAT superfamily N-acetyltransferase
VKPAYRRRGIQQALIVARLERGRERGSRQAFIISGPGIPTERNATRLGFGMAYTRVVLVKRGEGLMPSP